MKQLILNALKTKFAGVSEQILDRVATKLVQTVTTAEQVQTAVDGVTFQQVLESYGDSRATQATQTAVHNYETKYGLKDGAKVQPEQQTPPATPPTPPTGGGTDNTVAQALAELLEQNKKLNERLDRMDADRTTATRKQQISTLIEKLPENLRKAYSRTPVDGMTDEQFQTLVGDITSSINQKGAVFGKPAAQNGGSTGTEQLTKEQEAAISHRDGAQKEGQPF